MSIAGAMACRLLNEPGNQETDHEVQNVVGGAVPGGGGGPGGKVGFTNSVSCSGHHWLQLQVISFAGRADLFGGVTAKTD
jgi:hypothetical protein